MKTILVIDDDRVSRLLLRRYLESAGYAVLEACDGHAGLELFAAGGVDLVVVDIFMPRKDGLETIRELAATPACCPIVAISDGGRMGRPDFLEFARGFGADAALPKPLSRDEVLSTVRSLLG